MHGWILRAQESEIIICVQSKQAEVGPERRVTPVICSGLCEEDASGCSWSELR